MLMDLRFSWHEGCKISFRVQVKVDTSRVVEDRYRVDHLPSASIIHYINLNPINQSLVFALFADLLL